MRLARTKKHARLEMLSLMDVVFIILVFLVYSMMSMVVHMGMPVTLPTSKTTQPEKMVTLALTIQQDGSIWVDKERATLDTLPREIDRQMKAQGAPEGDQPTLQIFADAALQYQKLFNVLDVLKAAGLKKISLQSKEGS